MPRPSMIKPARALLHVLGLVVAASWSLAHGVDCDRIDLDKQSAVACRVDVHREQLRLFLNDATHQPLHTFSALERLLAAQGKRPVFAMNAGMFHPDYSPVGLFIDDGQKVSPLNTADGFGNFFLKPNGVFFVGKQGPGILESSQFAALGAEVVLATQSGPLLVQGGTIHPRLQAKSRSRVIRNGVGVDPSGTVVFAISEEPMNLYEFATLFRDDLHCPDALYLDGSVSSIHAPALRRTVQRAQLGPIIAVVEPAAP